MQLGRQGAPRRGTDRPVGERVGSADLSGVLEQLGATTTAVVTELSLSASGGTDDESSARVRLAIGSDRPEKPLPAVWAIAAKTDLPLIERQLDGGDDL